MIKRIKQKLERRRRVKQWETVVLVRGAKGLNFYILLPHFANIINPTRRNTAETSLGYFTLMSTAIFAEQHGKVIKDREGNGTPPDFKYAITQIGIEKLSRQIHYSDKTDFVEEQFEQHRLD